MQINFSSIPTKRQSLPYCIIMDPLSTLTIGGILKECAGSFLNAIVLPVLEKFIEGKIQDRFFRNGIQRKAKQHLDRAIDKVFPFKDFTTEHICEEQRRDAVVNLKAYLFDDESLTLSREQQEILEEWVKRMWDDPDCIQLVEAIRNEGRYDMMRQMLYDFPGKVVEPINKKLEEKDNKDAERHREVMACLGQMGNGNPAGNESEARAKEEKSLIEQINAKFLETREDHPSMQLMEISDRLFPGGVATRMRIRAKDEWSGKTQSVGTILKDSWNRGKNHIMIVGEGGIGKTVTLLNIPSWFSRKPGSIQIPAIYIPLYELNRKDEDPIAEYIKKHILNRQQAKLDALFTMLDKTWDSRPRLLLLVDGFNEIPEDARRVIGRNIDDWAELSGIQVITSSRFDTTDHFFSRTKYYKVELQHLAKDSLAKYLEQAGLSYPADPAIGKLISTPLMLNLFLETRAVIDQRKRNSEEDSLLFKEDNTAGAIIWNYLQCEVWKAVTQSRNDDKTINDCIVATEFIAPFVAGKMYDSELYSISEANFDATLKEAVTILQNAENSLLPERIKKSLKSSSFSLDAGLKNSPKDLLTKRLHILVHSGDKFRFMHQNFRDALVAIHYVNASYLVDEKTLPKVWQTTIHYDVMKYVTQIATKEDADRLWEQNRMRQSGEEATINMLELQGRKRNYDFSGLDFSGLDLRNISLYPYRVPGTANLLLPHNPGLNKRLRVSKNTFFPEGHTAGIAALTTTPDGKYCVSGSDDKSVRVWNIENGKCLRVLEKHTDLIRALSLTPDGKFCISGSWDKTLRVWNIETGNCLRVLKGHTGKIRALSVFSDGKYCISGSDDGTLRVWDIKTGDERRTLDVHKAGRINSLVLTPDDKHCITGSSDGIIRVWDIESGSCQIFPKEHSAGICSLSISPDGKRCVSGSSDKTVRVWKIEAGKCLGVLSGHEETVRSLSFSPDGKLCVSGSDDSTLRVWNIGTFECLRVLKGHKGWIRALSLTLFGKRCVSGSGDNTLRVWDIESGECLKKLEGYTSRIRSLSLTSDNKQCISGSSDRTLRVWDIENRRCLRVLNGHKGTIFSIALTTDNKRCFTGSSDRTIRVWDINTGDCLRTRVVHKGRIRSIVFTSDDKHCISGSDDGTIRVWGVECDDLPWVLAGHLGRIRSISITHDKRCVVGSDDGILRVLDINMGKVLMELKEHTDAIRSLSLTSNDKYCVSGSSDRTIRVWDINAGDCLRVLKRHKRGISCLSITPDGKRCVSGSWDKTLRVWDIESGECLKTLEGHTGLIECLSITPDGKHCVFSTKDTIGIIDMADMDSSNERTIHVLPVFLNGANLAQADVPEDLKETLRHNGASFVN